MGNCCTSGPDGRRPQTNIASLVASAQVDFVNAYWQNVIDGEDTVELVRVLHSITENDTLALTVDSSTGALSFKGSSDPDNYNTEELFFWIARNSLNNPTKCLFVSADRMRVISIQHPLVVTEVVATISHAQLSTQAKYYFKPPRELGDLRDNSRVQPREPQDPNHFMFYTTRVLIGSNSFRFNIQPIADVPL